MAVAGISVEADFAELQKLQQGLRNVFSKREMADILKNALAVAIEPALARLEAVTPRGPTGNLARAVNSKVKAYPRDGQAVGLIGYNQSGKAGADSAAGGEVRKGPDRAFHQWWLEFGTKARPINKLANKPYQRKSRLGNVHWVSGQNGYIASSFNKLGPFRMVRRGDGSFATDPASPKAFFKKKSEPFVIPGVKPGGVAGLPPITTAWQRSEGIVADRLQEELGSLLDKAVKAIGIESSGTISGE